MVSPTIISILNFTSNFHVMKNGLSRRSFIKESALTAGIASISPFAVQGDFQEGKLPREVWIAGLSQMNLYTETPELMLEEVIRIVRNGVANSAELRGNRIICFSLIFPKLHPQQFFAR
jgi:hypothetical protein